MNSVFLLLHSYELPDDADEIKIIGVYSTKENAKAAVRRLQPQPGFCDHPDKFVIDEYDLDQDNWVEGFFSYE